MGGTNKMICLMERGVEGERKKQQQGRAKFSPKNRCSPVSLKRISRHQVPNL